MRWSLLCGVLFALVLIHSVAGAGMETRTLEFVTREATGADVAVSPDGHWLVASILGHLFRLRVEGEQGEQLTSGPYYDSSPAVSPDGGRVAFVSDRDGREGNIFVLDLASGQISPRTHERKAIGPSWSRDGESIVYLRPGWTPSGRVASVHRIPASGGESDVLSTPPRATSSVFHLPDRRVAWTLVEPRQAGPSGIFTRIEVLGADGSVSTLREVPGDLSHCLASPAGDGIYCRRAMQRRSFFRIQPEEIVFVPLPAGEERSVFPLSSGMRPAFGVGPEGKWLIVNHAGRFWKVEAASASRKSLAFEARVRLEVREPVPPTPRSVAANRNPTIGRVLQPRLQPKGSLMLFEAAGFLWRQPPGHGPARRLLTDDSYQASPAFSNNGSQVAFLRQRCGLNELVVLDLEKDRVRVLASGKFYGPPSWSPDGKRLVLEESGGFQGAIVTIEVEDGSKKELLPAPFWSARPHFRGDGKALYYSANRDGIGALYELPLDGRAEPTAVTRLSRHLSDGLVSPDGRWLAFRRNEGIWVARLGRGPIEDNQTRKISEEGGRSFAFTPTGSAILYSTSKGVFRHGLDDGRQDQVPVRLEPSSPTLPPLLLRDVRVLDFDKGGFGDRTSVLLEGARIGWIGAEDGRKLPPQTLVVEAGGRYLVPGFFDFHVHALGAYHEAFLAYGITSVRDTGGSLGPLHSLNQRGDVFAAPVPRYFVSGDILEGDPPIWGDAFLLIHDEEEARASVRFLKDAGADFLKVYPTLSWPLKRAAIDEAHRLGLPVVGHGTDVEEVTRSVTLGFQALEHAPFPDQFHDDVLLMLAKAGTRWDPTVTVEGGDALLLRDEPERLANEKFLAFTPEAYLRQAETDGYRKTTDDPVLRGGLAELFASIRRAQRHGVRLHVGTDAPNPECFFGSSLHWELEFFVQAGLTPLEAIRLATREAAAALGAQDLGNIAAGQVADLVLLEADPLEHIRNTQSIWRVIKAGRLFDPEELRCDKAGR